MEIEEERQRRLNMWNNLVRDNNPAHIAPGILKALGIYGGAQGIWVDKKQTGHLTNSGKGVAVSFYHTVSIYGDDLSDNNLLYHYPHTNRPRTRDIGEIEAAKAAGKLGLPIFVIVRPTIASTYRSVKMGWIEGWDDQSKLFLVSFQVNVPGSLLTKPDDSQPFELFDKNTRPTAVVSVRPHQQRFRFQLLQRYGSRCLLCGLDIPELLDAVHLTPKSQKGSDDPRNGLILCVFHHRALDTGLLGINPDTFEVCFHQHGPDQTTLRVNTTNLNTLPLKPHQEALKWLWKQFKSREKV